ncbi:hypothetical protein TCAL_01826 [Tigriopus californicus]|uniref:C-type lectin domain-containing protein n=2 Tax=Tigriopus californicus TaxID=6832 RepID=A0A553NAP6_TIGCA|nr:hypothetical protein TCAL_01826 [Tigriopus californicus]|eukprot:TCALIF_01826-PA protein Name:"Similar to Mrc1 Macrophage mannose receptor 1 (Mus musculus)" AED:0.08 eAED:0.08 QI:0/1/0.5/1/1/1/2/118/145
MSSKLLGQNDCKLFDTWVEQVNGKRYKVNPQTLSKKGQENFCKSQGGQLAMIKSKVEEDIITTLIGDNQTWIGITNFHNEICLNESCEDHLAWSDGTMFKYDANMFTKDFNFGAGHNCCRIKGPECNDNDCASLFAGICEVTCSD